MWPDPRFFWWRCPLSPCHWPSSWEPLSNMWAFFKGVRVTHGKFTWFLLSTAKFAFSSPALYVLLWSFALVVMVLLSQHGTVVDQETRWWFSEKAWWKPRAGSALCRWQGAFLLFQLVSLFYLPFIPLQRHLFTLPLSYLQAQKRGRRGCNWGSHDNLEHRKYNLSCFVSGFFW